MPDKAMLPEVLDQVLKLLEKLPGPHQAQVRKDIQTLRELLMEARAPKFLILGRRGAGKSSLINAMFAAPVAAIGAVRSETGTARWYTCQDERGELRILDTRGLGDLSKPETAQFADAVSEIRSGLEKECPDVLLFLCKAKEVDSRIAEDLANVNEIRKIIATKHRYEPPVVAILTQVDELDPASVVQPPFAHEKKQANIAQAVGALEAACRQAGVEVAKVIPVCAYLEFENGLISYDRRWQIDVLMDYLLERLPRSAQLELARLSRMRSIQAKMARQVIAASAALCAAVGAVPIPVADLPVITGIQIGMITAIGYISGRKLNTDSAKEFITALGLNLGAGFALREAARALIKFVFPGGGSVISGSVAFAGTWGLGEAAIAYFMEGKNIEDAKRVFEERRKDAAEQE